MNGAAFADLRAGDPDRFAAALTARGAARERVMALLALNLELARLVETTQEATLGEMRLLWWREAVAEALEGRPRAHPTLQALARTGPHDAAGLDRLIAVRAGFDRAGPADDETFIAALEAGPGALGRLVARAHDGVAADAPACEAAAEIFIAHGLLGLAISAPIDARAGRIRLSAEGLREAGVAREALLELRPGPGFARLAGRMREVARRRLARAQALTGGRAAPAPGALHLASFVRDADRRLARAGDDPFSTPIAPAGAAARARLVMRASLGRL